MVPGLHVARIDSSKWAITARGFNGRFANKLLVLIDGRSVYSPLFSGVFWEIQDTMLEDVERIEVIRGPGGTMWGANAVNGVINIITKNAKDTQGLLLSGGAGTEVEGFGQARYGASLGENAHYRLYSKYITRDGFVEEDGHRADDGAHMYRGGLRLDWDLSASDSLTLSGDVQEGTLEQSYITVKQRAVAIPFPPFAMGVRSLETETDHTDVFTGNVLGRWSHEFDADSDLALQVYYDRSELDDLFFEETRDTLDLDFQHRFALGENHEVMWGFGYRVTRDDIPGTGQLRMVPDEETDDLWSAFVQDEMTLVEDRLRFTIGSKFEDNDYTGFEFQPSARLLLTPRSGLTLWASVSRAVRTASRVESDVSLNLADERPGVPPEVFLRFLGDGHLDSEDLLAYELGYRTQPAERLSLDIATFYHVYDNLRSGEPGAASMELDPPPPHFVVPLLLRNKVEGTTYGVEVSAKHQPLDWWRLEAGYTFLKLRLDAASESQDTSDGADEDPEHQVFLRSSMDLPWKLELDVGCRYVSRIRGLGIGSSVQADARLSYRPTKNLEFAVVGQGVLHDRLQEYAPTWIHTQRTEAERGVYASVTLRF